jgi:hypothetical protein
MAEHVVLTHDEQMPLASQEVPFAHMPQLPPQPSFPHTLPAQLGVHFALPPPPDEGLAPDELPEHCQLELQVCPDEQEPQATVPPQPSGMLPHL